VGVIPGMVLSSRSCTSPSGVTMTSERVAPRHPSARWAARQTSFTRAYWSGGSGAGNRYFVPLPAVYFAS
jgi:hypothetical protein